MAYPNVTSRPNFPQLEGAALARWADDHTFERSIAGRDVPGAREYVFYDGPPFANGLPHYGHILTGFVKDLIPRYQTMRGNVVHRRFGWDCHGLPAEVETEKELGISGHPEITAFGIANFNEACRTSVLRYTEDWRQYVNRQARWVDFDNDYKTLDLDYMESVMWAFKALWEKGLLYEGFKVVAYCWRCETALSNTETRMDDTYHDRQDPAVTVAFELEPASGDGDDHMLSGARMLAWTTTPWTLPANLGLAVGRDVDYAVVAVDGRTYVLALDRVDSYEAQLGGATRLGVVKGAELVGRHYRPLFDFFADVDNAFQVMAGDFVSTDEGTGIVHMAPGFGEDDQILCDANGIETVVPMDEHGRYTADVAPWTGTHVFDANPLIVKELTARGVVVRHDSYVHSYPHCWRCDHPLVYRGISSWFVKVTSLRERMVDLNEQINWVPEHIKHGSFGKWLANARDWNVSRNRFWGSPIPVWTSDDPEHPRIDVYGSIADLESDFGVKVSDLHRPAVDDLVRPNPDDPTGRSTMRRVPEVLDCWFESGSMPFAQMHYPFANEDWFETHYPGDFIVEYHPQTRGWFYTLHVLATALFDRPAFRNCVCHGTVLGGDGQKMSKSLRNYTDPMEVFDSFGADAMRWYLMSSPILRGGDFTVTDTGLRDAARQVMLPIWNAWYFLTLYANAAGIDGTCDPSSTALLDRYIIAKTHGLVEQATAALDDLHIAGATAAIRAWADGLTNWYIRRSRDRFWGGDQAAINTLHTVLEVASRVTAPFLPMLADELYRGLHVDDAAARSAETSVHLADWPEPDELEADHDLVRAMDQARQICSAALGLRKAEGRRVRQPLAHLRIATPHAETLAPFVGLIADEVNVREVELTDDVASVATSALHVVPGALGPRLGPTTQDVIQAVRAGDWSVEGDVVTAGGHVLLDGEYTVTLVAVADGVSATLNDDAGVIVLDVDVTDDLEREGTARDLIRLVQQARRDADLAVTQRIRLHVAAVEPWIEALGAHEQLVASEVLATEIVATVTDDETPNVEIHPV